VVPKPPNAGAGVAAGVAPKLNALCVGAAAGGVWPKLNALPVELAPNKPVDAGAPKGLGFAAGAGVLGFPKGLGAVAAPKPPKVVAG